MSEPEYRVTGMGLEAVDDLLCSGAYEAVQKAGVHLVDDATLARKIRGKTIGASNGNLGLWERVPVGAIRRRPGALQVEVLAVAPQGVLAKLGPEPGMVTVTLEAEQTATGTEIRVMHDAPTTREFILGWLFVGVMTVIGGVVLTPFSCLCSLPIVVTWVLWEWSVESASRETGRRAAVALLGLLFPKG